MKTSKEMKFIGNIVLSALIILAISLEAKCDGEVVSSIAIVDHLSSMLAIIVLSFYWILWFLQKKENFIKRKYFSLLIFSLILALLHLAVFSPCKIDSLSLVNQEGTHHDKWESFLQSPLDSNYKLLMSDIDRCKNIRCKEIITPDYEETARLVKLVEDGNKNSINLAFLIQPIMLPGHLLEEVTRVLGSVADVDPWLFINLASYYQVSDDELESMINMMPEYVIDDLPERKRAIQRRIDSLLSVQDPKLINTRDKAVSFLKKYLQALQEVEE